MDTKRIAVLGSTGSIGRQALAVIADQPHLRACALAAGGSWQGLAGQAREHGVELLALADGAAAGPLRAELDGRAEVLAGAGALAELVRRAGADVVLSGVVGTAGLAPTLAAIEAGSTLAIANKETLVMAGAIVMPAARAAGVDVLPVDSEHSAIFQCLAGGCADEVRRVVITASGGALRDWPDAAAAEATVDDALRHPTWSMGRKITIDSATLVNKALEIVEAHWLFGLEAERIGVVLHAESIVHSCVEYRDGSVLAQMGPPDMTTPIAYALSYPHRPPRDVPALDLAEVGPLTFRRPGGRFERALGLGYEAVRRGGAAGAVLNAANEAAVEAFLDGRIPFGRIVPIVEDVLNRTPVEAEVTLDALLCADRWARQQVTTMIG